MKIVFCLPGGTYSREFLLSWTNLLMQATAKGHEVMISQQYSSVVHFARSKCLGGDARKGVDQKPFQGAIDYDALMWIDSDMVFRPEDFFSLLESPHDVTAGLYMMEDLTNFAAVEKWDAGAFAEKGSFKFMNPDDIKDAPQYMPVVYTGMGWMLIRKGVVESIKYPWFFSPLEQITDTIVDMNSEDVSFCRAIAAAGHTIHVDTKIRVGHQKMMII